MVGRLLPQPMRRAAIGSGESLNDALEAWQVLAGDDAERPVGRSAKTQPRWDNRAYLRLFNNYKRLLLATFTVRVFSLAVSPNLVLGLMHCRLRLWDCV